MRTQQHDYSTWNSLHFHYTIILEDLFCITDQSCTKKGTGLKSLWLLPFVGAKFSQISPSKYRNALKLPSIMQLRPVCVWDNFISYKLSLFNAIVISDWNNCHWGRIVFLLRVCSRKFGWWCRNMSRTFCLPSLPLHVWG